MSHQDSCLLTSLDMLIRMTTFHLFMYKDYNSEFEKVESGGGKVNSWTL